MYEVGLKTQKKKLQELLSGGRRGTVRGELACLLDILIEMFVDRDVWPAGSGQSVPAGEE